MPVGHNRSELLGTDAEGLTKIGNVADAAAKAVFPHWNDFIKSSDGYVYTSPVGRFRPNVFGLYDTIGNAGEWSSDRYAADYYEHSPVDDPTGPERVKRAVSGGAADFYPCWWILLPFVGDRIRLLGPIWAFASCAKLVPGRAKMGSISNRPRRRTKKGTTTPSRGRLLSARIRNRMSRSRRLLPRRLPRLQQFVFLQKIGRGSAGDGRLRSSVTLSAVWSSYGAGRPTRVGSALEPVC